MSGGNERRRANTRDPSMIQDAGSSPEGSAGQGPAARRPVVGKDVCVFGARKGRRTPFFFSLARRIFWSLETPFCRRSAFPRHPRSDSERQKILFSRDVEMLAITPGREEAEL